VIITIVGGTGTLGTELIRQLGTGHQIRCVSRCELKQKELKAKFPHVETYLGDIRDKDSLRRPFKNADAVFHVAALKHIDVLEDNIEECIKTNILGTINVCEAAEGVKHLVFSSTDKAVSPINVYGMCKGISEKIVHNYGGVVYRWGNIINSRGAATNYFRDAIKSNLPVNVTHPDMSRFWIRIEDAVRFVLDTYRLDSSKGSVMIPPMKAAPVLEIINAFGLHFGVVPNIKITGMRPGEKIHESIMDGVSSNSSSQFTVQELVGLVTQ
jgi:UDP-N-acetylglucosamine 4,6-dehydratase